MFDSARKHCLPQSFRNYTRVISTRRGQQNNKFLPAKPRYKISSAWKVRSQHAGNLHQTCIAISMSIAIIQLLEVININHQQSQRAFRTRRPMPLDFERYIETAAVRNIRQFIL